MLHVCYVYATSIFHLCYTPVTFMLHVCYIYVCIYVAFALS